MAGESERFQLKGWGENRIARDDVLYGSVYSVYIYLKKKTCLKPMFTVSELDQVVN